MLTPVCGAVVEGASRLASKELVVVGEENSKRCQNGSLYNSSEIARGTSSTFNVLRNFLSLNDSVDGHS